MNQPSKRKIKFNIIDVLLILLIIALSYLLWRVISTELTADRDENTVPIEYSLTVSSIRKEFQGKAGIGDTVRDYETGHVIGKIVDVSYADATIVSYDATSGQSKEVPYLDYLTMTLTIQADAEITSGFYQIDTFQVQIDRKVTFALPGLCLEGTLTHLSPLTDSAEQEANA